jgi:hypothetical protein
MAATATTRARSADRPAPTSKKPAKAARSEPAGPNLQIRYFRRMKPNRTYSLIVEMPKKKRRDEEDDDNGAIVVVRPSIPGALLQPAEQRFEVAPGNQITFHVTPLTRGRLPRARLEIFAPSQPPQTIPLWMKAKTQRLAWFLLLLAFLLPTGIIKLTLGDWKPRGSGDLVNMEDNIRNSITDYLPPIPIVSAPAKFLPEDFSQVTIVGLLSNRLAVGYAELNTLVTKKDDEGKDKRWISTAVGFGFLVLSFFSWALHRPRKRRVVRELTLDLEPPDEDAEASTLEPV